MKHNLHTTESTLYKSIYRMLQPLLQLSTRNKFSTKKYFAKVTLSAHTLSGLFLLISAYIKLHCPGAGVGVGLLLAPASEQVHAGVWGVSSELSHPVLKLKVGPLPLTRKSTATPTTFWKVTESAWPHLQFQSQWSKHVIHPPLQPPTPTSPWKA